MEDCPIPIYGLTLKTLDGVEIYGMNSFFSKIKTRNKKKTEIAIIKFTLPINLNNGDYFISLGLAEFKENDTAALDRRYDLISFKVSNSERILGICDLNADMIEI